MSSKESSVAFNPYHWPKPVRVGLGVFLGVPFSLFGAALALGVFEGIESLMGFEPELDIGPGEVATTIAGFILSARYYYR